MRYLLLALLLSSSATAQDLLLVKHGPARLVKVDGNDGSIIDPVFVDIDGLLGLGGLGSNFWDVVMPGNGELVVSNFSTQELHRFSLDGTTYLGTATTSPGSGVGMSMFGSSLWVAVTGGPFGGGVVEYDTPGLNQVSNVALSGIWGVSEYNGQLLASDNGGTIHIIDTVGGTVGADFSTPGGFLEQMTPLPNGNLLVAVYNPAGLHEIDPAGNLVNSIALPAVGSVRGCALLGNGNYLVNGTGGSYVVDATTLVETLVDAGTGAFIGGGSGVTSLGDNYCGPGNLNSTGESGIIKAFGSDVALDNDFTLEGSQLPEGEFAFFLASRTQGFVSMPGGSQGNLCVLGDIARLNRAGEVGAISGGAFSLLVPLADIPEPPTLGVTILAGETWNFQCWHRDFVGGSPTSNFTDALEMTFQ